MEIQLNGQVREFEEPLTLQEILNRFEIQPHAIAVAVNGEIIPRSEMNLYRISAGDRIEVVHAVAGG